MRKLTQTNAVIIAAMVVSYYKNSTVKQFRNVPDVAHLLKSSLQAFR
jgi:hypothetical protein